MSDANARSITNSFQDVKLVSLASWSKAVEFNPRDKAGPYVVMQAGYDPQDLTITPDEFVLGRSGKWMPLALFYRLPVPDRRAEFIFGTAAEVMRMLGELTSKVVVFRPLEKQLVPEDEVGKDDMASTIRSKTGGDAPG